MTMKECYADAIEWLSKHEQNRIIIKVKSDKELKKYQEYFKDSMSSDLFIEPKLYDAIEWKIDSTVD